jgi:long-chain acyl-CoA synthetase
MSANNLFQALAESAECHASKPAVFWGNLELSFADVLQSSRSVGHQLIHRYGVKPGDRVGILLRNCPEFIYALFGVWQAGAVAVPINHFLKSPEVAYLVGDAGIDVLITEHAFVSVESDVKKDRPGLRVFMVASGVVQPAALPATLPPPASGPSDLAIIIYTSGTTGRPKGAMLTHGNLLHNVASCRIVLAAVDHDRFVLMLPMFHSFMLTVCILLPLLVGGSIVLIKSLHPVKNLFLEIATRQATILPAIPQFFRTLADADLPSGLPLRLCISGAAPLPTQVLQDFTRKHPLPLLEGYGLSETSPVASLNPIQGPWKAGSVGVPIPNVEMSVQDDEGHFLPPGQVGEICVRGGNVMLGYWNNPAETAKALRNGWLLTGDTGFRDTDGYFYITDRKKDMLLVNGINVYPREIEEVILTFPGVQEAAVVGEPDHRKGEHPVAFLVPKDGMLVDETALLKFLRTKLADYKVPRRMVILTTMPRNETGKILKTALRSTFIEPAC